MRLKCGNRITLLLPLYLDVLSFCSKPFLSPRRQFHQNFMCTFFCTKVGSKPNCKERKDFSTKNMRVKCWWNWHQTISISSIFSEQLLHAQVPKTQKDNNHLTVFCVFGICARKSCLWTIDKFEPRPFQSVFQAHFRLHSAFYVFVYPLLSTIKQSWW